MHTRAPTTQWKMFYLPGRLRIELPGVRGKIAKAKIIEQFVGRINGIQEIKVNYRTGKALIHYLPKEITIEGIEIALLRAYYYQPKQQLNLLKGQDKVPLEKVYKAHVKNFTLASSVLLLVLMKRILKGKSPWADSLLLLSISSALSIMVGYPLFKKGLDKATKEGKVLNYPLVIGGASLVFGALRESLPGLICVWLSYLNDVLQTRTVINCRRHIQEMAKEYELKSWVVVDGTEVKTSLSEIKPGMLLSIGHGEVIPVDGTIVKGEGLLHEGMLSGTSSLVEKSTGDKVVAGTIVEDGHILVEAEIVGSSSLLAGLNRFNQPFNHDITGKIDKNGRSMANVALFLAAINYFRTRNWSKSLAILLMGNPGNLHLARSVPLSNALRKTADQGLLVKSPDLLEKASSIDKICFDKTGTLTHLTAKGMEIIPLDDNFSREDILVLVAGVEKNLSHSLAKMLVRKAKQEKIPVKAMDGVVVPGHGVEGQLHGKKIILGSQHFLEDKDIKLDKTGKLLARRFHHLGYGILYVAYDGRVIGAVGIQEALNPGVKYSIGQLKSLGLDEMAILTGDRDEPAQVVSDKLGINEVFARTSPEDKVKLIKEFQKQGKKVAMVGDGANDSGALIQADLSFALNGRKNPGGIAAAGVVLPDNDLTKVPEFVELNKQIGLITEQNMLFVKGLNSLGLALASGNALTPFKASLLQNLGTIGVYLNSTRLGKKRSRELSTREMKRALREVSATVLAEDNSNNANKSWYNIPTQKALKLLESNSEQGLSSQNCTRRLRKFGPNSIESNTKTSWWQFFLKQFDDFFFRLHMVIAGIAMVFGKGSNAIATVAILVVNAVVGVIQEIKAQRDTQSLTSLTSTVTKICRDGKKVEMAVEKLVPGDIILLEAGDKVPADARILESENLLLDESILTGENTAVFKDAETILGDRTLAERKNMVYKGTHVLKGQAKAVVTATGFNTEVGKIANQLSSVEEQEVPIKKRMDELGRIIARVCIWAAAIIALGGVLRGLRALDMLMTAITLIVAAVPEGLSVIVLIAMALGVRRMAQKKVVVRKLPALETLGATTVVCCDKTGTLTKNELSTEVIYTPHKLWNVFGEKGFAKSEEIERILSLGILCNSIKDSQQAKNKKLIGDPTDAALINMGQKVGLLRKKLDNEFPTVKEVPFDSDNKMMSLHCKDEDQEVVIIKGAPEIVSDKCQYILSDGEVRSITPTDREKLNKVLDQMGQKALRVLALAYCYRSSLENNEEKLIFTGMVGLRDQIRPEAKGAVARCHGAGVKVVMITGDHPHTAATMAEELGLSKEGDIVLTGDKLDKLSDEQLDQIITKVSVFARIAPIQKLRIVQAFQRAGHVVAMTGDGVNDAPAIKAADIGIAMGQGGTDVARDAASLVLLDDNFTTIVGAMEEGRNIYFNIKKSVRYLIDTNAGEVMLMAITTLLGQPMPLTPIQLLWLNFIGDGLPAIALVSQEPGPGMMKRPPRDPQESIFANGLGQKIIRRGILIGSSALGAFWWGLKRGGITKGRTLAMSSLILTQLWHLFDTHQGIEKGVKQKNNTTLLTLSAIVSFAVYLLSLYIQPFANIFQLTPVSLVEWLVLVGIAVAVAFSDTVLSIEPNGAEA